MKKKTQKNDIYTKNESDLDRAIRITIGTLTIMYALLSQMWWLLLIGIPLLLTGIVGFCGLYALLGISTCPIKKRK